MALQPLDRAVRRMRRLVSERRFTGTRFPRSIPDPRADQGSAAPPRASERGPCHFRSRLVWLLMALVIAPRVLVGHDGGPPSMTLEVGMEGVYVIKSDVAGEGGLSF